VTGPPIALSGPPGSGKSTAGRRAAELLDLEFVSAGALFRAEAARRGLDLAEFSRLAESDPRIDRALDDEVLARLAPGRLVEGRLVGLLGRRRGIPLLYVRVTAPEEVRVARIAQRDHQELARARALTREREASERARYRRYYDLDLDDEAPDLSVDSATLPAEEVARAIARFARGRGEFP